MNKTTISPTDLPALQKKKKYCAVGLGVGVVLFLIGMFSGQFVLSLIGMAILVVSILLTSRIDKKIKEQIAFPIILSALNDVFERVDYRMHARLPDDVIEQTDMDFPFRFDRISGSDYVHATYKGLNVEFSDIELTETVHCDKHTDHVTRFKGVWMICDFGKELSADLILSERHSKRSRFADKLFGSRDLVLTENADFNDRFNIRCASEQDAFYILTPHMMESILRTDQRGEGDTYLHFTRKGKVHIAINSDRDSFEMHSERNPEQLKSRFVSEIRYFTDLIDGLRLADTLFRS